MKYTFTPTATLLALASALSLAACTSSSASDTDQIQTPSKANSTNNVRIGQAGFETFSHDDSDTFQRAISQISQNGGGQVIVPAGTYRIHNIDLKNDTHVLFEAGVTLVPGKGRGRNLFNCGNDGAPVSNVALIGPEERFTVDFTDSSVAPEVTKLRVIGVGDCDRK